jgi:hypothetical protein
MRRSTVFGLIGAVLVIGIGAYTAYWWIAAGKIADAASDWARQAHERQLDVSWQAIRVAGYPFSFRLELTDAVVGDKAASPPTELRAPQISASIWPWNFHDISLGAPGGLAILVGPTQTPLARLGAARAEGTVAAASDGSAIVWLTLHQPKAEAGVALSARTARAWVIVPSHPPESHTEPAIGVAGLIDDLALPAAPPELSKTVDQVGFGITLMGALPSGSLKQAAAQWRDSGGTLELDHLDLRWGAVGVTASGTLALDSDLQPIGGFSGAISGYDQLMNTLVAAGRVKPGDARIARLALALLAKAGPDGRPEISTSFAIQNGEMLLGPAKLGKAPRIDW